MISEREEALWAAKELFDRRLVSGSAGNISFRYQDTVYISRSGAIFGRLTAEDFVGIGLDGSMTGSQKPSKEYPLHLSIYRKQSDKKAIIHTHSFYSTLWSCMPDEGGKEIFPSYTPYIHMQFQDIKTVTYHKPGSDLLFQAFEETADNITDGYILKNHGIVVAGKSMQETFAKLEELETSAKLAWFLKDSTAIHKFS